MHVCLDVNEVDPQFIHSHDPKSESEHANDESAKITFQHETLWNIAHLPNSELQV